MDSEQIREQLQGLPIPAYLGYHLDRLLDDHQQLLYLVREFAHAGVESKGRSYYTIQVTPELIVEARRILERVEKPDG